MAGRASSRVAEPAPETGESQESATESPVRAGLRLELPPTDELLYFAGVGALAALEIIEWPVALVAAMGLALARRRRRPSSPPPAGTDGSTEPVAA